MDDSRVDFSGMSVAPPLTGEEWAKVTECFGEALELGTDQRERFLTRLRAERPATAAEVESLLQAHDRPGEFLPVIRPRMEPLADLSGRTLGAYRLIRMLGSGGMGAVYLAERSDGVFSKQVAVKLLSPALAHVRDRFHRERELLSRLEHPHIARLLDGGTTAEGWPYLVMDFVDGVPIDRYCSERDPSLDDRLRLLLEVCDGVAHAHKRLIIHCDIKPENILVTPDGHARLLDFGIARLLDVAGPATQYRAATPAYSSPEQLQGDALTTASDVYAIGVLGYVVLTGSGPYALRSTQLAEVVQAVLTAEPLPASRVPGVPAARARKLRGDLDNVLAKAVAKEPERRYHSAQQLADDLEASRRGFPVRARRDSVAYRMRRFVGRHRVACLAATLGVAALTAALVISARESRLAARRFDDLRQFARTVVFDVDDILQPIAGTTAARKLVVNTALQYLDRLAEDGAADPGLREELAAAYIRVGKIQGGAFLPNLGDVKGAVTSFEKAVAAVGDTPASDALERLGIEAHINVALLAADPIEGQPSFDRAIAVGERLLAGAPDDVATLRLMAQAFHGKATIAHVIDNVPMHEQAAARACAIRERLNELASQGWQDQADLAREYGQLALALTQKGDTDAALVNLRKARAVLETTLAANPTNQVLIRGLAENRSRTGWILVTVGRSADADAELESAIGLLTPLVQSDAANQQFRADLAMAWVRLGNVRRAEGRLPEALALHQQALTVRRERAKRDSSFMFVPWALATSLNAVGELLLEVAPDRWQEASRLFAEARDVAEPLLRRAPSFNELRRELAASHEGLGRAALAGAAPARAALDASLATWTEALARSVGTTQDAERVAAARALRDSLPASPN